MCSKIFRLTSGHGRASQSAPLVRFVQSDTSVQRHDSLPLSQCSEPAPRRTTKRMWHALQPFMIIILNCWIQPCPQPVHPNRPQAWLGRFRPTAAHWPRLAAESAASARVQRVVDHAIEGPVRRYRDCGTAIIYGRERSRGVGFKTSLIIIKGTAVVPA